MIKRFCILTIVLATTIPVKAVLWEALSYLAPKLFSPTLQQKTDRFQTKYYGLYNEPYAPHLLMPPKTRQNDIVAYLRVKQEDLKDWRDAMWLEVDYPKFSQAVYRVAEIKKEAEALLAEYSKADIFNTLPAESVPSYLFMQHATPTLQIMVHQMLQVSLEITRLNEERV